MAGPALAGWSPGRRDLAAVAVLVLLPLVLLWPVTLGQVVFCAQDVQHFFFPYHALPGALLRQGELPLWNATAFSGIPLVGDGQVALFYPPSWLFLVLRPEVALHQNFLLHFMIAGVGAYFFVRELGLHRDAALLAGVAFMFSGFLTARVVHLSIMAGTAWVPVVFLCVRRALAQGSAPRWCGWAALVVALQTMSGHPQIPIYTATALLCFAVVEGIVRRREIAPWRPALTLLAIYALGYLVAAVHLLPWLELARLSPRAAGASYAFVFRNSATPLDWLLFLFPYAYGSLKKGLFAEQPIPPNQGSHFWEHSVYVGMLPLALAGLTVWILLASRRRGALEQLPAPRRTVAFLAAMVVACMVLATGRFTPVSYLLYVTPVLGKLRDVERFMALADFGLAVLAAVGLQALQAPSPVRVRALRVVGALAIGVPLLLLAILRIPPLAAILPEYATTNTQLGRPNVWVPLLLAGLTAGLCFWVSRRPATPALRALLVAVVVGDLGLYVATYNAVTSPELFREPPRVLEALKGAGPFRKMTFLPHNRLDDRTAKESLAVSWGMPYLIEDINGFNSLQPRRYTDYLFGPQREDVSYGLLDDARLLRADSPILSSLNVKYLLVPRIWQPPLGSNFQLVYRTGEVRVYENKQVYPRAYLAEQARFGVPPAEILATVTADGFDGRKLALVEQGAAPLDRQAEKAPATLGPAAAGSGTVRLDSYRFSRQRWTVTTAVPRLLVLSEMWTAGWEALVDGQPVPVQRANYLFRAVLVPGGTHTVELRYRPGSLVLGAVLTAVGLLVTLALLALGRRRGPAAQPPTPASART